MLSYILRRLLLMIPTLIGITWLVFSVMALAPGGVAGALLSAQGTMRPQERKATEEYLNRRFGLDKPILVQYLRWLHAVSPFGVERYQEDDPAVERARAEAMAAAKDLPPGAPPPQPAVNPGDYKRFGFKTPDLGFSFIRKRRVSAVIGETLPVTLLLNVITIPLVYAIAVTTGIYAARHRGKAFDVASGTVLLALWSIPVMWTGVMAIGFLANKDVIALFPTGQLNAAQASVWPFLPTWGPDGFQRGWLLDRLWHLVLPVACLTYGGFAFLAKLMRASMLENLSADFARTARAKGLSENVVLFRHVLSNSLLPLITMAASILPGLLGGAVIVESIFSIEGMGKLSIGAINQRDQELVLSITLVIAVVSAISLLIADILYAMADPRITYD